MTSMLSQKIIALRNARHLTQQELADKLHLSRTLIAAWEVGRSTPSREQLTTLAEALEVSYQSLQSPNPTRLDQYPLEKLTDDIIQAGESVCEKLGQDLLQGSLNPVVQEVMAITSREQKPHENYRWQHPLDREAHKQFLKLIEEIVLPFFPRGLVVFSEESINPQGVMEPIILPDNRLDGATEIQTYVIVDPLDRTVEAVRALDGFANITIGSFTEGPLISIVFTLFHRYISCYYAMTSKGAWVRFHNGNSQPISPATTTNLPGAFMAAYTGKSGRFLKLATHTSLLVRHGLESSFTNASGCYGFCLVASSQADAFIEVAKGYAWHDIVSGLHILQEAGGVIKSPDFNDLYNPFILDDPTKTGISSKEDLAHLISAWSLFEVDQTDNSSDEGQIRRYPFIAAATYDLAGQIAIELAKTNHSK